MNLIWNTESCDTLEGCGESEIKLEVKILKWKSFFGQRFKTILPTRLWSLVGGIVFYCGIITDSNTLSTIYIIKMSVHYHYVVHWFIQTAAYTYVSNVMQHIKKGWLCHRNVFKKLVKIASKRKKKSTSISIL